MTDDAERIEYLPLSQIQPAIRNSRQWDLGAIHQSMDRFGFVGAVAINETTGRLVFGHGRVTTLRQKKEAGQLPPKRILEKDGEWLVPVIRGVAFPTDQEAEAFLLADNRTALLGTDDPAILTEMLKDVALTPEGLVGTGFDDDDVDRMLRDLGQTPNGTAQSGDPDAAPEPPKEPVTKLGDVWLLGRHRLLCGDGTDRIAVLDLTQGKHIDMVFTDPPYGVSIVKGGHLRSKNLYAYGGVQGSKGIRAADTASASGANPFGGRGVSGKGRGHGPYRKALIAPGEYAPVIGDESIETAVRAYQLCASLRPTVMIFWGANYYSHCLPPSKCWLVWDKENTGNFADVELAWTNQDSPARLLRHMWNGLMKASERGEKRVHPTQKPCALAEWAFETLGKTGDVVLDLFGGSGSSLIACERTGRTCLMIEMAPAYCDVIAARWEALTGQKGDLRPAAEQDAVSAASAPKVASSRRKRATA